MRKLAHIARKYDKGFGHFTTRTEHPVQLDQAGGCARHPAPNWPSVEMHCIQTSGNCMRNVTADHFAGATADEIEDPRPLAEIIRQWSSLHPEFVFLARKFKIAVGASRARPRRAAMPRHGGRDREERRKAETGYKVMAGGGMGRTPYIAHVMSEFVRARGHPRLSGSGAARLQPGQPPRQYPQAAHQDPDQRASGRRKCAAASTREFEEIKRSGTLQLPQEELARITAYFAPPAFRDRLVRRHARGRRRFRQLGEDQCPQAHRAPGYAIATISLKTIGQVPGDATAEQMDAHRRPDGRIQPGRNPRHP